MRNLVAVACAAAFLAACGPRGDTGPVLVEVTPGGPAEVIGSR